MPVRGRTKEPRESAGRGADCTAKVNIVLKECCLSLCLVGVCVWWGEVVCTCEQPLTGLHPYSVWGAQSAPCSQGSVSPSPFLPSWNFAHETRWAVSGDVKRGKRCCLRAMHSWRESHALASPGPFLHLEHGHSSLQPCKE